MYVVVEVGKLLRWKISRFVRSVSVSIAAQAVAAQVERVVLKDTFKYFYIGLKTYSEKEPNGLLGTRLI